MTDRSDTERQFLREKGGYLALHGKTLLDNGYRICPIAPGKKAPGYDGWEKSKATAGQLDEWLKGGFQWYGVGIITKDTPAIDIDVRDEDVALKMEAWVREHIGAAPMRIGQAPKRLFLFRTDSPFRKMRSTKYIDEWDDLHQIEILAEGQQFVAYAKHPDTGQPFYWPADGEDPLHIRASELITLNEDQAEALIAYFEECARAEGWKIKPGGKGMQRSQAVDLNNPWLEDTHPITMTDEELRARLLLVPGSDDYETWIMIGMSLHHQYDGEQRGLDLWHEWSETADNYDPDALIRRWEKNSFEINGKKRAPLTARYILKLSQEAVQKTSLELGQKLRDLFINAKDIGEWNKAREAAREAEIDSMDRSSLALIAQERRNAITGTKTSLSEVKKAIAFAPKAIEKIPRWCESWVYDISDDKFYNTAAKISTSKQGFDAMYDREAVTRKDVIDGKMNPTQSASNLALVMYRIPHVAGRRFSPGDDSLYTEHGLKYANTYAEHEIPELPTTEYPRDKQNVRRVQRHIEHLLANPREQRMFLDWISWVVQNPGKHANFGMLLQGVQGDGKTFWAELLRAVMGVSNVTMLNAKILHSDFTDWAAGQCVACVEEVRLINEINKYEVLNRIKPFTTNNIIEIHPKGKAIINVKNTTSYLLFSNYKDALPIDDNDRRFMIFFSRWQARQALTEFKQEHPDYYIKLYETIGQSAGALRAWLLGHQQSEDFNPLGDAPDTPARQTMIRKAMPAFIQQIDDMIVDNKEVCVSAELLDVTTLTDVMQSRQLDVPPPKTMSSMLERHGYEMLGRFKVEDRLHTFWSKSPDHFRTVSANGSAYVDSTKLREFLTGRKAQLEDDDDI